MDRHYLLWSASGTLRMEAGDRAWTLPPARAALIAAHRPIRIHLPGPVTACSALFSPGFVPDPPAALRVFDMTPLARALLLECRDFGPEGRPLDDHGRLLFRTLAAVTWKLALRPTSAVMPLGRSPALLRALALTEAQLREAAPSFEEIAAEVAVSPRSLARRFEAELGMTWRQALRRMRMIRAVEALAASSAPVTTIAFEVGYGSLSAFNAAFRDFAGVTPSAYRTSFREGPPP